MSSVTGQVPSLLKAVSTGTSSSFSASFQSSPATADSGSQRRPGGSGSFGAGAISRNAPALRNSQARKNQHKQRRPRLEDEDAYAESVVMKSTTSRKGQTSITHLMNFSLPPRPQYHSPPYQRSNRQTSNWGLGSGYHAIDKARYVHANYRFIVNPTTSYYTQAANADVHLGWDSVLQVLASAQTQATSCPICLSMPVAARMAKCGHIFCFSCLIRFMHSNDDENLIPEKKPRWKKCPICWDTIYLADTRPVRWFTGQENGLPVEGGDVVLRLVKRRAGSTLALPRDGAEEIRPDEDIPWYHAAEVADYARIMKGGEEYMITQYDAEIQELKRQEQEDELLFGDDTTWTRKAVASIGDAKERIKGIGNPPDVSRLEKKPAYELIQPETFSEVAPQMYGYQRTVKLGQSSSTESVSSTSPGVVGSINDSPATSSSSVDINRLSEAVANLKAVSAPDLGSKLGNGTPIDPARALGRTRNLSSQSDQPYYFYQALPHFYISPLDIRILKSAFGEYAQFPATILPRVEHISTGHVVDDELRKRTKYLGHLPHGCEVNFLECDWTDVVVPEILEQFKAEIEKRRRRNREKEVREEKDRVRAEKVEDEQRWAATRRKQPSHSASDGPFSDKDFLPLTQAASGTDSPMPNLDPSTFPPRASTMQSRFGALASPSASPPGPRTVWGTAAVAPSSVPAPLTPSDGWFRDQQEGTPTRGDRLLSSTTSNGASPPTSYTGRRKKGKKITIMSTNIQRGA